jgi:hypothetical protein
MNREKYESCIATCYDCATECKNCESSCLEEPNVSHLTRCIKLNGDCAAICLLAAQFMTSDSEFANKICHLCADICEACAVECEKHGHMQHCKDCAEVCRNCAEACREMAN